MADSSHVAFVGCVGAFDLRLSGVMSNIYLDLTNRFNEGKLRAVLSSGQAVVMHGLALSSKDGDWIIREDSESFEHILGVLEEYGATYRLGAPLDVRWLSGGWSSHFEFELNGYRARTDFVSRPPRLSGESLARMWKEQERSSQFPVPTIDLERLARLKLTERERDYVFIGEIARKLNSARQQMLWSRSARDLIRLAAGHPELPQQLSHERPLLSVIHEGRERLEVALDAERRELSKINEGRLGRYALTAQEWTQNWRQLKTQIAGLPLREAHQIVVERAQVLPTEVL